MTDVFDSEMAALACDLLSEFGETTHFRGAVDFNNPDDAERYNLKTVVADYDRATIDGTAIQSGDMRLICQGGSRLPEQGDLVCVDGDGDPQTIDDNGWWAIVSVIKYRTKPQGRVIACDLQCRV